MRLTTMILCLFLSGVALADEPGFGIPIEAFPERFNATASAAKLDVQATSSECSQQLHRTCMLSAAGLKLLTATGPDRQELRSVAIFIESDAAIANGLMVFSVLVLLFEPTSKPADRNRLLRTLIQPTQDLFSTNQVRLGRTVFSAMTVRGARVTISARRAA